MSENKDIENLKKNLFYTPKHAAQVMTAEQIADADEYGEEYKQFLNTAKTEREAVSEAVRLAEEAGFVPFDRTARLKPGDKVYLNNRGKSLLLAVIGTRPITDGVSIAAAHIDSPRLDLKPNPLYEDHQLAYFDTHYYGGIKKYQWTTIPLALHGVIVRKDGSTVTVRIGEDETDPVFCVTDLLPHLGGEQMKRPANQIVKGEDLNLLIGSRPLNGDEGSEMVKLNIMSILHKKYGIVEDDFLSAELEIVPAFRARDLGFDRSMIAGYGHDDRVCAYPALTAILRTGTPAYTAVTILADKEEIGSDGNTGMKSSFLPYFIDDLAAMFGEKGHHVLSRSVCLSADVNAAFDNLSRSDGIAQLRISEQRRRDHQIHRRGRQIRHIGCLGGADGHGAPSDGRAAGAVAGRRAGQSGCRRRRNSRQVYRQSGCGNGGYGRAGAVDARAL